MKQAFTSQRQFLKLTQKQATLYYATYTEAPGKHTTIRDLSALFTPKRQYKTLSERKITDVIRVYSALLEHGDLTAGAAYESYLKSHPETNSSDIAVAQAQPGFFEGNEGTGNPLLEASTQKVSLDSRTTVSGANVAKLMHPAEISSAKAHYLENKKGEDNETLQRRLEKERVKQLKRQISQKKEEKQSLEEKSANLALSSVTIEHRELNEKLRESIKKFENMAELAKQSLSPEVLGETEELLCTRNKLKEKQRKFKEECEEELNRIQTMQDTEITGEAREWFATTDRNYNAILSHYEKTKEILAENSRKVVVLQRRIEETPSQTELNQYQRRFVELYETINLKLEENRKLYTNYNNLLRMRDLLQSEVEMLNSFQDRLKDAKKNSQQEEFMKNLQGAIGQVEEKAQLAREKTKELSEEARDCEGEMKRMQEEEKFYYKLIKEIQDLMSY